MPTTPTQGDGQGAAGRAALPSPGRADPQPVSGAGRSAARPGRLERPRSSCRCPGGGVALGGHQHDDPGVADLLGRGGLAVLCVDFGGFKPEAAGPGRLPARLGQARGWRMAPRRPDHGHGDRLRGLWRAGHTPRPSHSPGTRSADRWPAGRAVVAQAHLALSCAGVQGPDLDRTGGRDPPSGGADQAGPRRGLPTGRQGCPRGRRGRP
jgi:hypothetical protein